MNTLLHPGALRAAVCLLLLLQPVDTGASPFPQSESGNSASGGGNAAQVSQGKAGGAGDQSLPTSATVVHGGSRSAADRGVILPPGSTVYGKTLPEWSAAWWQWALRLTTDNHPWFDETGAYAGRGQTGSVFFLVGVVNVSGTATRSITLPPNTHVFFPILNFAVWGEDKDPWGSIELPRDASLESVAFSRDLHVVINGRSITDFAYPTGQPVTNVFDHREIAPDHQVWLPPTNNIFQYFDYNVSGYFDPASADGFWIMLAPLAPGCHQVTFGGTLDLPTGFTTEVSYFIVVQSDEPKEILLTLICRIERSSISSKEKKKLIAPLQAALEALKRGKSKLAANQVKAFENKVRALSQPGRNDDDDDEGDDDDDDGRDRAPDDPAFAEVLLLEAERLKGLLKKGAL